VTAAAVSLLLPSFRLVVLISLLGTRIFLYLSGTSTSPSGSLEFESRKFIVSIESCRSTLVSIRSSDRQIFFLALLGWHKFGFSYGLKTRQLG
jgi:hypothetical protein